MLQKLRTPLFTGAMLVLLAGAAAADVPNTQRGEVEHLLEFIRSSACRLERNGREYDGERAYRHVMRKYDYFRNDIHSTEQFIELAASKSLISGEPYWFVCDDTGKVRSQRMLLEELARYRAHPTKTTNTGP